MEIRSVSAIIHLLSHLFLKHLDAEISENRGFLSVSRGEEGAPAIDQENDEKRGQKQLGDYNDPEPQLGTARALPLKGAVSAGFRWSPVRYVLRRYVTAYSVALIEICD